MAQYKYPVRFFYGAETGDFSITLLGHLSFFHSKYGIPNSIIGETGIEGVLLDFNIGLRMQIPKGNWHVKISDYVSNFVFIDEDISAVTLISAEKFFVHWEIILSLNGKVVFYHQFEPQGQKVHFIFPEKALGDNLTFFPYMNAFKRIYDCQISCTVPKYLQEIVKLYYPNITLTDTFPDDIYATYYMVGQNLHEPFVATENIRAMPLVNFGQAILGWNVQVKEKVIYKPTKQRQIKEPYVCIAVQASGTPKTWLNPNGWNFVVDYLKQIGYRVLCIDKDIECADFGNVVRKPDNAEDFTGNIPLIERINLLAYADFFIGLGSGLSWLAWSVDIPVILISGISAAWCEFATPYRINNNLVCHGCYNDLRIEYEDVFSCPRYKGKEQIYECSKKISAQQVINAIDNIVSKLYKWSDNIDGNN